MPRKPICATPLRALFAGAGLALAMAGGSPALAQDQYDVGGGDCRVVGGPGAFVGIATGLRHDNLSDRGYVTFHHVACFRTRAQCEAWLADLPWIIPGHDTQAASYCRPKRSERFPW